MRNKVDSESNSSSSTSAAATAEWGETRTAILESAGFQLAVLLMRFELVAEESAADTS